MPKPKIKHTKKVGDEIFHKLAWGDEKGGEWIEEDLFEALIAEDETSTTTCNTRKSRDKRERKHTVGAEVEFVTPVTPGGSVNSLPVV